MAVVVVVVVVVRSTQRMLVVVAALMVLLQLASSHTAHTAHAVQEVRQRAVLMKQQQQQRKTPASTSFEQQQQQAPLEQQQQDQQDQQQEETSIPVDTAAPTTVSSVSPTPAPPAADRHLRVLQAATFLAVLSSALVAFTPATALAAQLGTARATTLLSNIAASAALLEILVSPAVGSLLLDLRGRKPVLQYAVTAVAVTHAVAAVWPTTTAVAAAKFVALFGRGSVAIAVQAMTSDLVAATASATTTTTVGSSSSSSTGDDDNSAKLSAALGVNMALVSAGFFVGALAAGPLSGQGISTAYATAAVVGGVAALLVYTRLPETLPAKRTTTTLPLLQQWNAKSMQKLLWQSPTACTRLLVARGPHMRILAALLVLQALPMFAGDFFQLYAKQEWHLHTNQFSSFVAVFGVVGIAANTVGSVLVRRWGIQPFLGIATLSSMLGPMGAAFFGFRGLLAGAVLGFLGGAQQMGISAALMSQGAKAGVPRGELAGEWTSLIALLKVISPILYSTLYIHGGTRLGLHNLPFLFNIGLAACAFLLSQTHLAGSRA